MRFEKRRMTLFLVVVSPFDKPTLVHIPYHYATPHQSPTLKTANNTSHILTFPLPHLLVYTLSLYAIASCAGKAR